MFGSTARGTDTPDSDVDLLVDLRDPTLERVVDLSAKLTAIVGRPVDVVRLQEAEADPSFLSDVVTEGRVLVDREELWARLLEREPTLRRGARRNETRRAEAALAQRTIVRHLEDFPRQYAALETAMAAFGEDFDVQEFKRAFGTRDDMEAYNRVQAVERAVSRVQNFVAELAGAGMKLARISCPPIDQDGSSAQQAFEALRDAGVIGRALCRRLVRAQKARSMLEHGYVETPAGDVHRAAELVHATALDFIGPYRAWIEPFLTERGPG